MLGHTVIETIKAVVQRYMESQKPAEFSLGVVTSVEPLKIKVENRLEIDETFLLLSAFVKEKWINIPEDADNQHIHIIPAMDDEGAMWQTDPAAGPASHVHTIPQWKTKLALPKIKLWRGLKVGDAVRMIRLQNGQLYYVIERVEGITNDA